MAAIMDSSGEGDSESSDAESRGHWQYWVGAFVVLGGLFTLGWAFVETWWG